MQIRLSEAQGSLIHVRICEGLNDPKYRIQQLHQSREAVFESDQIENDL